MESTHIVWLCIDTVTKMKAKYTLEEEKNIQNVESVYDIEMLRAFPRRQVALVHSELERWNIYELVKVRGGEVEFVLASGNLSTFAVSSVRPYYKNRKRSRPLEATLPQTQRSRRKENRTRLVSKRLSDHIRKMVVM